MIKAAKRRSNRWRQLVKSLTAECEFGEPASDKKIAAAEAALGVRFPRELRSVLKESNGIWCDHGLGRLVWPVERIQNDNLLFRSNEDFRECFMPFDPLLFFADAGNGDCFAFAIHAGVIRRPDVFAWDHEDDSRRWQAPSLAKYLEWWLTDQIKL
jgi:hypothetical protein